MKTRTKLKGREGFSLAETMLAVLILLLVSVIVANGIPVARNVYNNVIVGANAQTLLSTTVTALRNELGTARQVQVNTPGTNDIIYYKNSIKAYAKLSSDESQSIQLMDYVNQTTGSPIAGTDADGNPVRESRPLVSDAASNGDNRLIATYESVEKIGSIITFHNIQVKRSTDDTVLAELGELDIRLSPITD